MNRETYIRKVKKQLDCSVKEKEEIVRDLQEIFDSGKEHGKSESQIIKQLGKPQAYAQALGCGRQTMPAVRKTKSCCSVFGGGWTVLSVCTGRKSAVSDAEKCHWRWGCDDDDRAAKLVTGKQQRDFWGIGDHRMVALVFLLRKRKNKERNIKK